jgi:hypothetical protein
VARTIRRLAVAQLLLVLIAAACAAATGYFLFFSHPKYSAKAMLYVTPPTSSSPTDAAMGDQYAANRTQLYLQLVKSNDLAQRVAAQLQSSESPNALAAQIRATSLHQAPLIEIQATASDADTARSLAQAYADQFPDFARTVEQNTGIREGPVIVPVAAPLVVTKSTTGWRPWLTFGLCTLAGAGVAFGFVLWSRHRHPTARNIGALRDAMQPSMVEGVGRDPAELQRIQAMLFAAPKSARHLILASARRRDRLEDFSAQFTQSLRDARIHSEHVTANGLDTFQHGLHSTDIVVFDAPALLEEPELIAALAIQSSTAVIVARGAKTFVQDVVQLGKLLQLNGIRVTGVLSVSRGRRNATRRRGEGTSGETAEQPWPTIDVLEAAMSSHNENRTPK